MVKLIEEQMWEMAKEKEKKKRQKQQARWDKDPKKKGRKVPRHEVSINWTRGVFPKLCQDTDSVATVYEYDYDLLDTEFQAYCRTRGVLHIAGTPESTRWEFCVNYMRSPDEYFKTIGRTPPKSADPEEDPLPPEADTDWKIIRIARGKLQDCWELFQRDR